MPFFDVPYDYQNHNGLNPPGWRPVCDCELACMRQGRPISEDPYTPRDNPDAAACFEACRDSRSPSNPACTAVNTQRTNCRTKCGTDSDANSQAGPQQTLCATACNDLYSGFGMGEELHDCLNRCEEAHGEAVLEENNSLLACLGGCDSDFAAGYAKCARDDARLAGVRCEQEEGVLRRDTYSKSLYETRVSYARCVSAPYAARTNGLSSCAASYSRDTIIANNQYDHCINLDNEGCNDIHTAAIAAIETTRHQCRAREESAYLRDIAQCDRLAYQQAHAAKARQMARDDRDQSSGAEPTPVRRKRQRGDSALLLCCKDAEADYRFTRRHINADYAQCHRLAETIEDEAACLVTLGEAKVAPALAVLTAHRKCMRTRCLKPGYEDGSNPPRKIGDWLGECLAESTKTQISCVGDGCEAEALLRITRCHRDYAGLGCNHLYPVRLDESAASVYLSGIQFDYPDSMIEPSLTDP